MAGFTGLSPEYLRASQLRVSGLAFGRDLLADQEKDVGCTMLASRCQSSRRAAPSF